MSKKGKFIVIDGSDGSGKATQTKLLVNRLKKMRKRVHMEDFPQYGNKSAGSVEDYLNGLYGTAEELGPYIPSIFYASDRFAAKKRIQKHLDDGYVVVSNRYVTASMAHQGGKIRDKQKRYKFFKWLHDLEYKFFKIPKPNLHLILHIPAKISQRLIAQKGPRYYIGDKKRDIHENDLKHLIDAENTYLEISKKFNYTKIECLEKGILLSPEEIHELVWKKIKHLI
ncbi:MAG: hypothetical protein A3B10_00940 [Candidatus Doudnabacteria bacterium RIFCSPLOWO2_01_FULL_44_21]|uniref:Thymidylate kinase-like domain-containing protein n=1 Tax=Candidatus Doudnabacteria bacterium RIFCSPLOWO2_01_FULL_44_21 TaxID=1817841 RepID=A0A1F5PWX8_9BACT|nr:MAG: hypothetical protein A3B95_03850 [Candidatus Doudnabacteria bacterium RIFCSPHIGHO2_02_FULL_43_13b]OGE94357.1 MAG: hypothetical protein A3B10_00940 [Candidatus Doudnabacteria bacterium RIFCSPLOWO2_01_FULL_44_21]